MSSGPSKTSSPTASIWPSGSSGPTEEEESQCWSASTTSAYRPLPGRSKRGSGGVYGGMKVPSRAKSLSAYASAKLRMRW